MLANVEVVDNMRRLEWGGSVPAEAPAAWGARAIYHLDPVEVKFGKDGRRLKRPRAETRATIELLWDRKSAHGESAPVERLCKWLDATGLPELRKRCEAEYLTGDSEDAIEFEIDGYKLRATPNESFGYLYIVAWKVG